MPPKYSVPTEPFPLKTSDGEIQLELRGLSPSHIAFMVRTQGDQMEALYQKAMDGQEITAMDTQSLVLQLLDEAPILLGLAISFGVGSEDLWEGVLDIPLDDQAALLDRIVALTFAREGGSKKVMGIIQSAIAALGLGAPTAPTA